MDITQIYMASPDWIQGLMVALPFLTVYATARLFVPRPAGAESVPAPQSVLSGSSRVQYLAKEDAGGRQNEDTDLIGVLDGTGSADRSLSPAPSP